MCNLDVESTNRNLDPQRLRDECIIASKVYDSCRQQDCNNIHQNVNILTTSSKKSPTS